MSPDIFLSFPPDQEVWVAKFQKHLVHLGVSVFLEDADVPPGQSMVAVNQEHLDRASVLGLVLTPEALVRRRLPDLWSSFTGRAASGQPAGTVVPLLLVDTPLPPALHDLQPIDFRQHDEDSYRTGLSRLLEVAGKMATDERLKAIEAPSPPRPAVLPTLRSRLVATLRPLFTKPGMHLTLAGLFELARDWSEGPFKSSPDCASSALLVLAHEKLPVRERALKVVQQIRENRQDLGVTLAGLEVLEENLRDLLATGQGDIALRRYLESMEELTALTSDYLSALTPAFVQLQLRQEGLAGRSAPVAPPADLEGLRPLVTLALQDPPVPNRPWLLRGDPGSGKSVLLRWLAAELAREAAAGWDSAQGAAPGLAKTLVPLYFPLPQLMQQPPVEPLELIESRLRRSFPQEDVTGFKQTLELAGEEGRLVVLLDGLDEVASHQRGEAIALAMDLAARRWARSLVILSSRRIGLQPPAGSLVVDILPLDDARRLQLMAAWLGQAEGQPASHRAAQVLEQLRAEPGIWGLTENPLYLSLIALLLRKSDGAIEAATEGGTPARLAPLRHRCELYDYVFGLLLEGRHRDPPQPMPNQIAVRGSLRHFARRLTEQDLHSPRAAVLEAILLHEDAEAIWLALQRHQPWKDQPRLYLEEMAGKTGILAPYDGEDWRFQHRVFREALVAELLAESLAGDGGGLDAFLEDVERRAGAVDRWVEPYALCIEASPERDLVIRQVAAKHRAFGLRALAGINGLQPATLQEILALTEDWRERREVILKLIEQVDGEDGLLLLDKVRQTTSNGNDLYFLEQALAEAGRRDPDLEAAVQEKIANLYGHLPALDPALFRTVETPDGTVPLWCEIPAGSQRIGDDAGSPEEGPVYQVTVDVPFRLSAVPVTRRQYAAFDPGHDPANWLPELPVVGVTWYAAQAFCRWLARAGGEWAGARLPTEEEWEYACAASGSQGPWWCSASELPDVAWFRANSEGRCHAVATRRASPLGLFDLHGNVKEWCLDPWRPDHRWRAAPHALGESAVTTEDEPAALRPLRGGCWEDSADRLRRAARQAAPPGEESAVNGFRIVLPALAGGAGSRSGG